MLPPTGNRRAFSVEPTLSVCNRDAGDSRYRDGAGEKAARAAARARKKGGAESWPINYAGQKKKLRGWTRRTADCIPVDQH